MALSVELAPGDTVSIYDGRVIITVTEKSGRKARMTIAADKVIPIEVNTRERSPSLTKKGNG